MEIRVGGLRWRLSFRDALAARACAERFASFTVSRWGCAIGALDLSIGTAVRAHPTRAPGDVSIRREGRAFIVRRVDFEGVLDVAAGSAHATIAGGPGSVASFLRVATSLVLAPVGGLLLHAASVVEAGHAFVFAGESGAGKTTLCRLSAPRTILGDEVSAIVPWAGGLHMCFAMPFSDDFGDGARESPAFAPLGGVLLPVKDDADAVVPVAPSRAFGVLGREAFCYGRDEPTMLGIAESCARIAASTPCAALHFRKSPAFWSRVGAWAHGPLHAPSRSRFAA